jgi:hypothetical protein
MADFESPLPHLGQDHLSLVVQPASCPIRLEMLRPQVGMIDTEMDRRLTEHKDHAWEQLAADFALCRPIDFRADTRKGMDHTDLLAEYPQTLASGNTIHLQRPRSNDRKSFRLFEDVACAEVFVATKLVPLPPHPCLLQHRVFPHWIHGQVSAGVVA